MGIIRMGAPMEIIVDLQKKYGIKNFIETGTYCGDTAFCASQVFERVLTIEYSQVIYEIIAEHFKQIKNIKFLYGDTREKLGDILAKIDTSSLFWLDAHWSGNITYGEFDQCPLLEEIEIINSSEYEHFIFIDDARLFMSPPPFHNLMEQWPDINTVLKSLNSSKINRYIVIIEDVIIAVPEFAKPVLAQYCQKVNTKFWENYKTKLLEKNHPNDSANLEQEVVPILSRPTNLRLIIFPDWYQPEESLILELKEVIQFLVNHPAQSHITLLINIINTSLENAKLILSSVTFEVLLQENLNINEQPEIVLLGEFNESQWEYMLHIINCRISLVAENKQAIADLRADSLPTYTIDEFKNKQIFQTEKGTWNL